MGASRPIGHQTISGGLVQDTACIARLAVVGNHTLAFAFIGQRTGLDDLGGRALALGGIGHTMLKLAIVVP